MKKTTENRYPHSATLFRFCKEALEIRYEGNVKVIDQDVGAILGYDPADCSHWKKGKKNIRALSTLRSIADHLNIDERLLIDIASGKIDYEEALFEYQGYGHFALKGAHLEALKKNYFKNPSKWQKDDSGVIRTFEEIFDIDRGLIAKAANDILERGHFTEAPIYLPEILQVFPNIQLREDDSQNTHVRTEQLDKDANLKLTIYHRGTQTRPYLRFLVVKEIFRYLCATQAELKEKFANCPEDLWEIQANIFAGMLLVPGPILKKEVEKLNTSMDIVIQLAEIFWVSKAFMNQRLRDYMEHLN